MIGERKRRAINDELPQFKLEVPVTGWDSVDLHFVHKRSSRLDAIPLIFIHGCDPNSQNWYLLSSKAGTFLGSAKDPTYAH